MTELDDFMRDNLLVSEWRVEQRRVCCRVTFLDYNHNDIAKTPWLSDLDDAVALAIDIAKDNLQYAADVAAQDDYEVRQGARRDSGI